MSFFDHNHHIPKNQQMISFSIINDWGTVRETVKQQCCDQSAPLPQRGLSALPEDKGASPGKAFFFLEKVMIRLIFLPAARLIDPVSSEKAPRFPLPEAKRMTTSKHQLHQDFCFILALSTLTYWIFITTQQINKTSSDLLGKKKTPNHLKKPLSCVKLWEFWKVLEPGAAALCSPSFLWCQWDTIAGRRQEGCPFCSGLTSCLPFSLQYWRHLASKQVVAALTKPVWALFSLTPRTWSSRVYHRHFEANKRKNFWSFYLLLEKRRFQDREETSYFQWSPSKCMQKTENYLGFYLKSNPFNLYFFGQK